MLISIFEKLKENKFIELLRQLLHSKWMMIAIIALAAISNIFGVEIIVYYIYTLIIIFATLFADDLLPLLPIACCGYMTFAKDNNPMGPEQKSTFLTSTSAIHMLIIGLTVACFVIPRIIYDIVKHKDRRTLPKLLWGFIFLGLAYILGGLFSDSYSFKTAFFGLVEILTLSFSYFIFYYTVDWKKVNKNYFAVLFTMIGFLMVIETFTMLVNSGIFTTKGEFSRSNLFTGWGHYNNVASILILTIPAPFYFACKNKNGWIYTLISSLFLLFTILTQSRNGMLVGSIAYSFCSILVLFKTKGVERKKHILTYIILLILLIILIVIFKDLINNIFASVYDVGTSDNGRIQIYKDGLKQFKESFILGKGFYECKAYQWGVVSENSFLPPRYHNTYIQLLASCGLIGLVTYLFHRIQTIKLFIKKNNVANLLIGISLLTLIFSSMLDCHFFNLGPGFLYSALLLLAEKVNNKNNEDLDKKTN